MNEEMRAVQQSAGSNNARMQAGEEEETCILDICLILKESELIVEELKDFEFVGGKNGIIKLQPWHWNLGKRSM